VGGGGWWGFSVGGGGGGGGVNSMNTRLEMMASLGV